MGSPFDLQPSRRRAALLSRLGFALCLLLSACSSTHRADDVAVISKKHRVVDRDRVGFHLHDGEDGHGFLRVTLRVHLHDDQLGERYTVRLRVRNEGAGLVVVDLEHTLLELGGEASIRWNLTRSPLEGPSELALAPGTAATTKLFFDLRGPRLWPLGVPLLVRVPYRVEQDAFEISVPFVKRPRATFGSTLATVAEFPPLLVLAFAFDMLMGGIEVPDREHDSVTLELIGSIFDDGEPARRLEAASRVRREPDPICAPPGATP